MVCRARRRDEWRDTSTRVAMRATTTATTTVATTTRVARRARVGVVRACGACDATRARVDVVERAGARERWVERARRSS